MRFSTLFAALFAGSASTVTALALPVRDIDTTPSGFTKATPGGIDDLVITKDNTLNGTYKGEAREVPSSRAKDITIESTLPLSFVNSFGGPISAYLTGLDPNGAVVFIRADGTIVYPSSGGSATPVPIADDIKIPMAAGQTLNMDLPISLSSARIYFAAADLTFAVVGTANGEGLVQPAPNNLSDPSATINWGFVELTLTNEGVLYANISYVDFLGLPLGMQLTVSDGSGTQTAFGVEAGSVGTVCSAMQSQTAADGRPWGSLCIAGSDGSPVRALSPTKYTDLDSDGFATYWDDYVNQVWAKYTSEALTIDTQNENGLVSCQVSGDVMNCAGDNRGYNKPTAKDIWGCDSGPFGKLDGDNGVHLAVIPRLCAAFVRTTLLLDGGNVQPSLGTASYYTADPTNHYSRSVHEHEVDGKGYAFAYDDVNPSGENASGTVSSGAPGTLTVYIGSPPS